MTRCVKNVLTVLILLLCLTMLILTVLSALGRTASITPTEGALRGEMPSLSPGGDPSASDDVEIGEMPGIGEGTSTPMEPPEFGTEAPMGGDRLPLADRDVGTPSGGALLPYLAFAGIWLFLLAFTLAWALFSRMNAYSPFARHTEDAQHADRPI